MTVRKTFQWTVVLVAIIAAGGWYVVRYAFDHKDQLVLQGIRQEVARTVPDWGVVIGGAKIDLSGQVWLSDVTITPDPEQPPLVTIPKCLVTIDPDLLLKHQQLLVRSVRIVRPQVVLARTAAGEWNWQRLNRPAESDQTPEVTIEQGELFVRLQAADGVPQTELGSRNFNLRLVPDGRKRYLIEGASHIEGAGALAFGGKIDFNNGAWRLLGQAEDVDMSQVLLEKAAAFAPDVLRRVAELSGSSGSSEDVTLTPGASVQALPNRDGSPVQTTSLERGTSSPQLRLPNLGLSASIGLAFDLSSDGTQAIPDYRVLAKVVNGTVTEPLSPVPLSNLQGELLLENGRLRIHKFSAGNGESKFSVSGEMWATEGRVVRDFDVSASNLLIDDEIRYFLSPGGQRLFDLIRPAGLFTIRGRFRSDGVGAPVVRLDEFTALDCSMSHQLFPYPVTGITGTVKQTGDVLRLELNGTASGQPVWISGTVTNPGPEAEATVRVQVNGLPLDRTFVQSLVNPQQQPARRAIEALGLTGRMDVDAAFVRSAGRNQPTIMGIDADVTQGTVNYERFPYVLTQFSGHVKFDPWKERVWHFTNLSGVHGAARLAGSATYDLRQPGGGLLDLNVTAQNVTLDQDLHRATTTAVPELHDAWLELNPESGVGTVDFENVHLTWVPGTSPTIELPSIQVKEAAVTLASFPFRWENVSAGLAWSDDRVTIHQIAARHRETRLQIEGRAADNAAYFQLRPTDSDERWHLHLADVHVHNLDPGGEFRRALPGDVAAVLTRLNPRGPIDANIGFDMMGFPNHQGGPNVVTSDWEMKAQLQQDRLSVGIDLTDVTGTVEARGNYNGEQVFATGALHFDKARALDMTFTDIDGPFTVDDQRVTVGSSIMLQKPRPGSPEPQVPPDEQLTASLYDGSLVVNADALLSPENVEQTQYRARVRISDADLKQWADEWEIAGTDVNGTAHGDLNLYGTGTSELSLRGDDCMMTITKARLGKLPVIAEMLTKIVAPKRRDNAAFNYAYLDFSIHDGVFDFGPSGGRAPDDTRRILLGGVVDMVGTGYVPFAAQHDPQMDLNFYSKADKRNPILALPIFGPVAKSISDNLIHVRARGTPADPEIRMTTEVPVNNALRQLFQPLEAGLMPRGPRRR